MRVQATVKNTRVELVPVPKGQKAGTVRRELGLGFGDDYSIIRIGGMDADVDDAQDFEYVFPGDANALKNAGVDLSDLSAVIEIRI